MGILVRERPPLRLSLAVAPPGDGVPTYRWGEDDPDIRNRPDSLSFTTTMPGGFDQASCQLERNPRVAWPDLQEYSNIQIRGLGGSAIAWEGRLEEYPSTGGSEANFQPQMYGWQSHLQDNSSAAMVYVEQGLGAFQDPPLDRQIWITTNNFQLGSESVGDNSTAPALVLEFDDSWVSPIKPIAEAWFDSSDMGPVAKVWYSMTPGPNIASDLGDANWIMRVILAATDDGVTTIESTSFGPAAASGYYSPATAMRWAYLQMLYNATPAGGDNMAYQSFWEAALYGAHGLTGRGSDPVGFWASDIIGHAVSTWAPKIQFTTGASGSIQPSSFVIPQAAYAPTTVSAIIADVIQYELLDWAVWERTTGTTGPTLYVNARGARGKQWFSRVGQCQLQNAGPQASNIYNGVIVTYTDASGATLTAGPTGSSANTTSSNLLDPDPTNPANEAGINRWGALNVGTSTAAGATQAGEIFLAVQKEINTSGQATLTGHVQDNTGTWWPAWMVRAGDTLVIQDAADTSARRIVSTSYDDTQKANSVQLDQPAAVMNAVLAQMAEVLTPLGLS